MARGWDSKSIEEQMDSFSRERRATPGPRETVRRSSDEAERLRQREMLALSHRRVTRELESATNERYREYLRRSLAALDLEIVKLG
ncbi:MAG: hypothetical protein HY236_03715 [Acidobacteria bacterium]|nr:hypothetical protein [Acidobacteriota bacterium]